MSKVLFLLKKYAKDILLFTLVLGCLTLVCYEFYFKEEDTTVEISELALLNEPALDENEEEIAKESTVFVDVKGAVKTPGVYEVKNTAIINDVIKLAGGFKTGAYTSGINLSKKIEDEMVIYVYTNNEIKSEAAQKQVEPPPICEVPSYVINECIDNKDSIVATNPNLGSATDSKDEVTSNLININTADVTSLMTLSGIGESKAEAIIKYREENGNFKSTSEITNVSGIGEALFEKIKDSITI